MNKQGYVTIFKNIAATATPYHKPLLFILERIRSCQDQKLVNEIRFENDKTKRNLLKRQLPSILFSGVFSQRSASGLVSPSGYIVLDFDNFETDEELNLYKKAFIESPSKGKFTHALFVSPSGKGLKCIIKIPASSKDHKAYFTALKEFYNDPHLDSSGSDICRACFISADADLYYNEASEMWCEMERNESYSISETTPILKLKTSTGIVQNIVKWFNKNYTLVKGENVNSSIYILCAAFNDFGLSKHECESYVLAQYGNSKNEKELFAIIKSAYKKEGGTKFFEDKQALELIERSIRSGVEKKKIYKKFSEEGGHTEEEIDGAISSISESMPISEFWYWTDKGDCRIRNYKFKLFLEQNGFYKFYPEGSESFIFIKIENNMIDPVTVDVIKDFVLKYLEQQPTIDPYEAVTSASKMFKDDYLNLISEADIMFFEDTQDKGCVYFKNGAAITKTASTETIEETALGKRTVIKKETTVELVDYLNLNGFVWRKYIIDREYSTIDFKDCVYDRFISLIAGKNPDKILSIKSTIGYLMHSFKTSANNKAVILNDETISDNPNGGSGKGVFCAALGHMKRLAILNGKTFDGNKSFAYQTVGADTQLLLYDDIPKNFNFENLFSVVTEGITLEKKNKDAIKLSVGKSPKIIITTNYTIGGVSGSHERRKWELEFSSYFSVSHTPLNEFGHLLFDEWDELEWKRFDNLMIDCLRIFLENGLIKQEFKNLKERKFIKETCFDFHEWVTDTPLPVHFQIVKSEYFTKFITEYEDYNPIKSKWFTQKRFSHWLTTYGSYKGYKIIEGRTYANAKCITYLPEGMAVIEEVVVPEVEEQIINYNEDPFDN